jgi:hypothetical protein
MPETPPAIDSLLGDVPRLGPDDTFQFACRQDLDCFTRCCHDVSIVLTPYDVLRLKNALGISSSELLARHTISPVAGDQPVPVVLLRMDPETKRCPFVCESGCRVYRDRPWACRMYPLGLAEPQRATLAGTPFHFLVREDLCQGHAVPQQCSVREWIVQQGIEEYDANNASFTALMLDGFWDRKASLTQAQLDMLFMAWYDLDRFRRFVLETSFLARFDVDETRVEAMRTDEAELLEFAMQWVRFCVLGQKTMRVKPTVVAAAADNRANRASV